MLEREATSLLHQQRIESIFHQTVESTLRRLACPPEGNLRTGLPSVDTCIQTGDSRSKLCYCLKTIEEEYGISNFRGVYFRLRKEYVIRCLHGNQFLSDNHILSYIRTSIPWICEDCHPFLFEILECIFENRRKILFVCKMKISFLQTA